MEGIPGIRGRRHRREKSWSPVVYTWCMNMDIGKSQGRNLQIPRRSVERSILNIKKKTKVKIINIRKKTEANDVMSTVSKLKIKHAGDTFYTDYNC